MKKLKKIISFGTSVLKQAHHKTVDEYIFDKFDFIKDVSFTQKADFNFKAVRPKKGLLTINWIIPNIGLGGGGHLNIFRFIQYLQSKGHENRIYIIGDSEATEDKGILSFINKHYLKLGNVECFRGSLELKKSDVTFATSWETAYYVYYDDNTLLKSYFVQDYEPFFFPLSSEYVFAEMTYQFGFYSLCASTWLGKKVIRNDCGSVFELGVDLSMYRVLKNEQDRGNKLFVYLRSNTPRRATELLLLSLKALKDENSKIDIIFAGQEDIPFDVPFEFVNYGVLHPDDLPKLYNEVAIALVGSLTNYSLLPQELMACGCLVVDLKLDNNLAVHEEGTIVLAGPSPFDVADKINYFFENPIERSLITSKALERVKKLQWNDILQGVEENLLAQFK